MIAESFSFVAPKVGERRSSGLASFLYDSCTARDSSVPFSGSGSVWGVLVGSDIREDGLDAVDRGKVVNKS